MRCFTRLVRAPALTPFTCRPLVQADDDARADALQTIVGALSESLASSKELLQTHLRSIVRFAHEVPFQDLTSAFQALLQQVEAV